MNVERMLQVADAIERESKHFNMGAFFGKYDSAQHLFEQWPHDIAKQGFSCGTTACIAGWAVFLFARDELMGEMSWNAIEKVARRVLDLSTNDLFYYRAAYSEDHEPGGKSALEKVTAAEAAAEIRRRVAEYQQLTDAEKEAGGDAAIPR